ncbi:Oidioi.mRNA.OKI2018_I69.XSR.g15006.t1.cds [Oikopleura dioica]|uniref:Oidioi.mRNA.OKI2018_I69.XSR.g15006.t1.cds n=1 Tax=Oikopleura dioica TaxID=34765 RepID=A0ABN7SD83_OIKDI|nr:Oidioi.mRNA.OKI2018_I69.XSR.g15006.t1.cds [Oikopleura dioica]
MLVKTNQRVQRSPYMIRGSTFIGLTRTPTYTRLDDAQKKPSRVKSAPARNAPKRPKSAWAGRREQLLSRIRDDSWSERNFIKCTEQQNKEHTKPDLENASTVALEETSSKNGTFAVSRPCSSFGNLESRGISFSSAGGLGPSSAGGWRRLSALIKVNSAFRESLNSPASSSRRSVRSSRSRRSIQSRMRNLTSGANSVIFEKYNVRAGFEAKKLFQKSVRLVIILMRAGGCFRRDESLKVLDDGDMRFYDTNSALGKMAHVFNPTIFRADKSLKVPKNVARDLKTHPDARRPDSIGSIVRSLQIVLDVFSDYPLQTQKDIAKYAYLEEFEPGRMIFKKSDRPLRFHLVVSGRALVTSVTTLPTGEENIKVVETISRGETFGDEGGCFLKQNGKIHEGPDFMPRENTVISQKHMTVLTLDGEDYIRIFHPEARKRFQKKLTPNYPEFYFSSNVVKAAMKLLQKNPFLRYWPLDRIKGASTSDFRLQYFRKGTVITTGNAAQRELIFVKLGSCQVVRRCQYSRVMSAGSNPYETWIEERRLDSGDMFGFECQFDVRFKGIVYKDWNELDPDVALISNGAEVIIFSAPFYRKHLNEQCRAVLTLNLEQKQPKNNLVYLLNRRDCWENYKTSVTREIIRKP